MKKLILLQVIIFSSLIANCQWQQLPQFTNARLQQIQFVDEDTGWIKAHKYMNPYEGLIFRTTDGGQTWDSTLFDHAVGDIYFIDSDIGFATGADSLIKTIDGGISWTYYPSSIGVENMSFIDANIGWTMASSQSVVKTVDGGDTWSEIFAVNGLQYVSSIYLINGDIGYVATRTQTMPDQNLHHTNDGGYTWTSNPISFICTDIQMFTSGVGYAIENYEFNGVSHSRFLKTNDHGVTWTEIPTPIADYEIFNDLYFSDENTGWISISTSSFGFGDGGIFYTSDGGQTWIEQLDQPVAEFSFIDENRAWALRMTFDPDISDYVFHTINGGVGINEQSDYKDELMIFPNPSNSLVTLSFELFQKENISISIQNINGQELKQIPVGLKKIGNFDLNCCDFAPGIYFVTLKTDSKTLTKKLIIE